MSVPLIPPTGTVTFLFTDIEGSTILWEAHPDAMRPALARHDALLRQCIEANGGFVFKTVGDAFCAAFATAPGALAAALDAQIALAVAPWTADPPLRVRMALHTGAAEERDGDYFGAVLNRVARLLLVGHGAQVLLSDVTQGLTCDTLPPAVSLRDLGEHRLKDLGRPETVFQLQHPSLPGEFPPLRSLNNPGLPNNLPQQPTSFIGREKEIAQVKALLDKTRLLTLTGAGGSGKTRLSLQVAADLLDQYSDGVWMVELASLSDPALVAQAVADALGVREEGGKPLLRTLADALKPQRLLLVLDNCEHVLSACAALAADLLKSCPHVSILASSREPLTIAGETVYRVPLLSLPDPKQAQTVESLSQYEAVRLFIERAQAVQTTFAVTDANAPAVAQVCFHLDGIPFAIELAAARIRSLSVEEVNARLDNRFRLLTGGARTALPRQQTLRAALDWSYDLLIPAEKTLLARLSVFAGGWTLEAAEVVCADETLPTEDILDLLTSLADKSLVTCDSQEDGTWRYRLLETTRQYAHDRLAESGGEAAARARHHAFFLSYAEALWPADVQQRDTPWWYGMEAEQDNLWAAWAFCRTDPDAQREALRFVGVLWYYWYLRGSLSETYRFVDWALSVSGPPVEAGEAERRARLLNGAGVIAQRLGDLREARRHIEQAAALRREIGPERALAVSLGNLTTVALLQGEYEWAESLAQERLALSLKRGDEGLTATSRRLLGLIAYSRGDLDRAQTLFDQCLPPTRAADDPVRLSALLYDRGQVARARGDFATARAYYDQARAPDTELYVNVARGDILRVEGDLAGARACYAAALLHARRHGLRPNIADILGRYAALAAAEGEMPRAVRLFAADQALRAATGCILPPVDRQEFYDDALDAARDALSAQEYAAAWTTGHALPTEQAIEDALTGQPNA